MENESRSYAFGKNTSPTKKSNESTSTEKKGPKEDSVDITALVRSLQRTEGNPDCFRKALKNCDQFDCVWRSYCLEEILTLDKEEGPAWKR